MSDEVALQHQRRLEGTLREGAEFMPTPMGNFRLEFLEINPADYEVELRNAPAEFGWLGTLHDALKTKAESKKLDIDEAEVNTKRIEGEVYLRIVEEDSGLGSRDPKRRTVDAVKAIVNTDQQVINARLTLNSLRRELLDLEHGRRQVSRIVSALEMKGKMLQSAIGLRRSLIELELQDARAEVSARQSKGDS